MSGVIKRSIINNQRLATVRSGFTLIELLVVIAIIGILSGLGVVVFTRAQAKARDGQRRSDLRNLQEAVEMYYADNNSYPSTGGAWWGQCSNYGSYTATCGANTFIPNICADYIGGIPKDPRADASGSDCYLYRSDGNNYMILAHMVMETVGTDPGADDPMDRVCCTQPTIAVYSAGARNW